MSLKYIAAGALFWGGVVGAFFLLRPRSMCHKVCVKNMGKLWKSATLAVMAAVILLCVLPMGLVPVWNGEIPGHRNQYEVLAESILSGHIYLDYGDMDSRLLEMENPYDKEARDALGINYHWDHAFYDGHYYMYFGVVPVFLLFLPYRIFSGGNLTTYHATQIFTAFFICGIFATFHMLAKRFFPRITWGMYVSYASAVSIMSIWYSVSAPALYCTAITSGLCMEIWSLYFFMRAVWVESEENRSIFYAFWGSFFGGLAFGCRPTIALANLLALPLLVVFMRKRRLLIPLIGKLTVAASPYVMIGILLMAYNYARFRNPFEFGQSYQLTVADQSMYGDMLKNFNFVKTLNMILENFISYHDISENFPYISYGGALVNFPILIFPLVPFAQENIRGRMKRETAWGFMILLAIMPIVITVMITLWVPLLSERYRQDIYWLMGISLFLHVGFYYENAQEYVKEKYCFILSACGIMVILTCFFLFLVPKDSSYTYYNPEILEKIRRVLIFGMGQNNPL